MTEKFEKFTVEKSTLDLEKVDLDYVKKTKNPIIFDTNFLFVTFQFNVDIISELRRVISSKYNLYIYEGTIDELMSVERKKDKNKQYLPLIVKMLHIYDFKIIKTKEKYIDAQIISNLDRDILIATNDKELKLEIQEKGFRVMYLRQKSYLEIK